MTNSEILKKAIDKAIKNGWNFLGYKNWDEYLTADHWEGQAKDGITTVALWWTKKIHHMEKIRWEVIIYRHDFAKAFWGEEFTKEEKGIYTTPDFLGFGDEHELYAVSDPATIFIIGPRWKFYLSQIVLEEEPLKYLEKFL